MITRRNLLRGFVATATTAIAAPAFTLHKESRGNTRSTTPRLWRQARVCSPYCRRLEVCTTSLSETRGVHYPDPLDDVLLADPNTPRISPIRGLRGFVQSVQTMYRECAYSHRPIATRLSGVLMHGV